jgi:CitB family two-component system sensor histidine kinase MalK
MTEKRPFFRLQSIIIFLVCGIVAVALLITNVFVTQSVERTARGNLASKAMTVSRIVALSSIVIEGLDNKPNDFLLQEYTGSIRTATDVEFVVVFDMQGIRKSHPKEERIGKHLVGGDEAAALQGNEYISLAKGTLGPSLRAFSPVRTKEGRQVGAVVVGILLDDVEKAVNQNRSIIHWATAFGLVGGMIGAVALARRIKRTLFGLEPFAIAKLLEERNSILQSTREGILAVDSDGIITVINSEAARLFGMAGVSIDAVGQPVENCIPQTRLHEILRTEQAEYDQEQNINGVVVLTNRVPLFVKGELVGALATFRDMTEIRKLAEELTGVNGFLEALRARAHEFLNTLHVIWGLTQLKQYSRLDEYITRVLNESREEVDFVGERIKDPILAGVILSKLSRARESGVAFFIDETSNLPVARDPEIAHGLVTIIGNLLDNAFEAVKDTADRRTDFAIHQSLDSLKLSVADNGPGIPPTMKEQIFEKHFSTKGEGRGYGLFLVARAVEKLGGTIEVIANKERGTVFLVTAPYPAGGDAID